MQIIVAIYIWVLPYPQPIPFSEVERYILLYIHRWINHLFIIHVCPVLKIEYPASTHSARDGVFQTELSVSRPSPPHYKKRGIYTSTHAILKNLNIDVNFSERDKKQIVMMEQITSERILKMYFKSNYTFIVLFNSFH